MEYTVRIAGTPCETRVSGGTLAEACALLGHPLELVCGGNGRCGKCDVLVERRGVRETVRACITPVTEDITVFLEVSENASAQILTSGGAHDVFAPAVTKAVLSPAEREPEHCGAYLRGVSLAAARQFSRAHRDAEEEPLTFIRHEDTLLGVQRGDTAPRLYGAAVDIGTTTVAMYIYDLTTGAPLHTGSALNGQIRYGADVINRIIETTKPGGIKKLQDAVIKETINPMIHEMCRSIHFPEGQIYRMCVASNTTMNHLFAGINADYLRTEPYIPAFFKTNSLFASDVGIEINKDAHIIMAPNIGSYVGGDITAGTLVSMIWNRPEFSLFIDLGTNGELVFGNSDFMMSCACSAGPAFEGGDISCGMRATDGAIEACTIDKETMEPTYKVVGEPGTKPVGLCGSGIIDVISELYMTGIINPKGKFVREGKRVRHDHYGMGSYVIAFEEEAGSAKDVEITEVDIDNFIRAKGAIFSAIRTMLTSLDFDVSMIDDVYVAGGIGSGINMQNAVNIGMFPDIPIEKFHYIGNSSLTGAYLMLLSTPAEKKTYELASNMTYMELSTVPIYMDEFVGACFIPHTDTSMFPTVMEEIQNR